MINRFPRSIRQKIVSLTSLCLLVQILITYPLWFGKERLYPLLNTFDALPLHFEYPFRVILSVGLLLCLLVFVLGFYSRFVIFVFYAILFLLIAEDINRLQVWVYQLSFFLFLFFLPFKKRESLFIPALQMGMAGIYCWSGLHKLNIYFLEDIFPWMVEPLGLSSVVENYPFLAIIVAIFEIGLGFGLLFPGSRKISAISAIIFHTLILFVLSPFGHNWNAVVWPWNLTMIGLVYLLFFRNSEPIVTGLRQVFRHHPWKVFALLAFLLLPALNFFQHWDEQLSFKMYSGHSPEGVFYFKDQESSCFPEQYYDELLHFDFSSQTKRIIMDEWAFKSLQVAPYKSRYRIIQAAKKLCECVEKTELAGLEILEVQRWSKDNDEFVIIPCTALLTKNNQQLKDYFNKK